MVSTIVKSKAMDAARAYCEEHNISIKRLEQQRTQIIDDALYFGQRNYSFKGGLENDIASQPPVTLIVRNDYTVEETAETWRLKPQPTQVDIDAVRAKAQDPYKTVLCPRCGNELKYKDLGNAGSVICETEGCLTVMFREL